MASIYLALAVDASPRISPQVEPSHAVVIVEGNYLLLKGVDPWDGTSALFDQTWAIRCPPQVCGERCGAGRGGAVRTKKLNTCSRRLATLVLDRVDGISLVFAPVEGRTLKKNVMPVVCVCTQPPPPIQASRYFTHNKRSSKLGRYVFVRMGPEPSPSLPPVPTPSKFTWWPRSCLPDHGITQIHTHTQSSRRPISPPPRPSFLLKG